MKFKTNMQGIISLAALTIFPVVYYFQRENIYNYFTKKPK